MSKAEQRTRDAKAKRSDLPHPSPEQRDERVAMPLKDGVDPAEALRAFLKVDPETEPEE